MWRPCLGDESSEKFKYSCHNGVYIDTSENATSVMYCGSCDYVKASDAFDRSECSR